MQAMLMVFITTNMSNSGIPSTKANSVSRTFPPLFRIKIPEEEQIVEDLQEIESMQFIVLYCNLLYCTIVLRSWDIHAHSSHIVFHFFLF